MDSLSLMNSTKTTGEVAGSSKTLSSSSPATSPLFSLNSGGGILTNQTAFQQGISYLELMDKNHITLTDLESYVNQVKASFDPTDRSSSFIVGDIGNLTFKLVLDQLGAVYDFRENGHIDFLVGDEFLIEVKNWGFRGTERDTYRTSDFKGKGPERFYKKDPDHEKSWYLVLNPRLWDKSTYDLSGSIREECKKHDIHLIRFPQILPFTSRKIIRRIVQNLENDVAGILDGGKKSVNTGVRPCNINSRINSGRDNGRSIAIIGKAGVGKSFTTSELLGELNCEKFVITDNRLDKMRKRYEKAEAKILTHHRFQHSNVTFEDPIFVFEDVGKTTDGDFINDLILDKEKTGGHFMVVSHSLETLKNSIDLNLVDGVVMFKGGGGEELSGQVRDKVLEEFVKSKEGLDNRTYVFLNIRDQMIAEREGESVSVLKKFLNFNAQKEDYRFYLGMGSKEKKRADYQRRARKGWQTREGGDKGKKIGEYLKNDDDPFRRSINREIADHYDWDYEESKGYIKKVKSEWKKGNQ